MADSSFTYAQKPTLITPKVKTVSKLPVTECLPWLVYNYMWYSSRSLWGRWVSELVRPEYKHTNVNVTSRADCKLTVVCHSHMGRTNSPSLKNDHWKPRSLEDVALEDSWTHVSAAQCVKMMLAQWFRSFWMSVALVLYSLLSTNAFALFVYWSYILLSIMLVSGYPSNHELSAIVTCIYYTDDLNLL